MSSTSSGKSKNVISSIRDKISFKKSTTLIAFLTAVQSLLAQNFDLKYIVEKINNTTMRVTTKIIGENDGLPVDFLDGGESLYNLDRSTRSYTETHPDSKTYIMEFPVQNIDSMMFGLAFRGLTTSGGPTEEITTLAKIVKNGNEYDVSPINAVYGDNQGNLSNVESGGAVGEITNVSTINHPLTCNTANGEITISVVGNTIRYPLEVKLYDDTNTLLSTLTVSSLPFTTPTYVEGKKITKIRFKDNNGMTDTRAINLVMDGSPDVATSAGSITGASTLCTGTAVMLTAHPVNASTPTIQWYRNGVAISGAHSTAYPAVEGGTYSYTVQNTVAQSGTNCYNTSTVYASPNFTLTETTVNVSAGIDKSVCEGDQVTLSGSGATTYNWTGGVTNGVAFTPSGSNQYIVTGTTGTCTDKDTVNVTVKPKPTINAGVDQAIIAGQSATLAATATAGSTINWTTTTNPTPFATGATTTVTPTATTNYITTADLNGCLKSDTVKVTVSPATGIKNNEALSNALILYPNPASDKLSIKLDNIPVADKIVAYEVRDLQGRLIVGDEIYDNGYKLEQQGINLSTRSAGQYIFLLRTESGEIAAKKIQKE